MHDISAANLQQLGTDGMEWYNVHGNFIALLGGQGDIAGEIGNLQQTIDALKALVGNDHFTGAAFAEAVDAAGKK